MCPDIRENTRLFGLLNMAMADGYIGTFEAKYHYNYWRPVTAIQLADTDGNPYTIADPAWEPLLPTPPVPDYDSGHSVEGGAAAYVLKGFFKDDDISFTACNLTLPVVEERCGDPSEVRCSFTGFTQAAEENSLSRIYNDFIFAMQSTRVLSVAARSPIARSATFCSRCGNSRKDKRMGQRLYPLHLALLRGEGNVRIRLMTDEYIDTVREHREAVIDSILRPRHNETREGDLDGGRMGNPWRDRSNGMLANR
jgi:hypothetical protein